MIVISVMDTLQILAWTFVTNFRFWKRIEPSHIQEGYPSTSLDESSIEFEFETDRSIYLDMSDIHFTNKS